MSSDKSKTSSQTDGKAAQSKKSEMGMMSYKMNFCGEMYILEKGEYPRWDSWSNCQRNDYLLSFRPVRMDPEKHKICLYEVESSRAVKWRSWTMMCPVCSPMALPTELAVSLSAVEREALNNITWFTYVYISHTLIIGSDLHSWVGYQYPGYRGSQYLLEKGDYRHFNEYGARCPQFQSVRRIRDMQWHQQGCYTMASK
ncbi:hypothetical protein WMY93_010293 [Mugilogobius chulae]|uniref:Beta/gamma crystallin 'Greek key' domain-containing protein n=1 Tax=Mugilogobius chulae TaxID=88201 RepID=A0AAW0PG10_9GOBI